HRHVEGAAPAGEVLAKLTARPLELAVRAAGLRVRLVRLGRVPGAHHPGRRRPEADLRQPGCAAGHGHFPYRGPEPAPGELGDSYVAHVLIVARGTDKTAPAAPASFLTAAGPAGRALPRRPAP